MSNVLVEIVDEGDDGTAVWKVTVDGESRFVEYELVAEIWDVLRLAVDAE